MAVYEHVLALDTQGYNQTEIAQQLRMSRKKVRQLLKGPPQPPIYKQRSTKLAPYKSYLTRRFVEEGCENSLQLYREICAQGYDGCRSVITNYVGQLRQHSGRMASTGRRSTTQPKPLKDGLPLPVLSELRKQKGTEFIECLECYSSLAMKLPVSMPSRRRAAGETHVAVLEAKSVLPSGGGGENGYAIRQTHNRNVLRTRRFQSRASDSSAV